MAAMAIIPQTNDVLYGRGIAISQHPGNRRYRSIVDSYKEEYLQAEKRKKRAVAQVMAGKRDKRAVAQVIISKIRKLGGRFLIEEPTKNDGGNSSNINKDKGSTFNDDGTDEHNNATNVHDSRILAKVWVPVDEEKIIKKVLHRLREKNSQPSHEALSELLRPSSTLSNGGSSGGGAVASLAGDFASRASMTLEEESFSAAFPLLGSASEFCNVRNHHPSAMMSDFGHCNGGELGGMMGSLMPRQEDIDDVYKMVTQQQTNSYQSSAIAPDSSRNSATYQRMNASINNNATFCKMGGDTPSNNNELTQQTNRKEVVCEMAQQPPDKKRKFEASSSYYEMISSIQSENKEQLISNKKPKLVGCNEQLDQTKMENEMSLAAATATMFEQPNTQLKSDIAKVPTKNHPLECFDAKFQTENTKNKRATTMTDKHNNLLKNDIARAHAALDHLKEIVRLKAEKTKIKETLAQEKELNTQLKNDIAKAHVKTSQLEDLVAKLQTENAESKQTLDMQEKELVELREMKMLMVNYFDAQRRTVDATKKYEGFIQQLFDML